MKKIILCFLVLFLTGCYDYKEINELSFISGIAIDYNENSTYEITLEILSDQNIESDSYYISASGKNLSDALSNAFLSSSKTPYLYHLKVVIVSESIAKSHMNEVIDYLIRNPKILNGFYIAISKNISAKNLITQDNNNVSSSEIVSLIRSNTEDYTSAYLGLFEDFANDYLDNKKAACLTLIEKKDKNFRISGQGIFKNDKLSLLLNNEEAAILNSLKNNETRFTLNKDKTVIEINKCLTKYELKKNVNINLSCEASIIEDTSSKSLKDSKTYEEMETDFNNIYKQKIITLLKKLNTYDIDGLNIKYKYYQKNNQEKNNYLINNINIKINIDKKGLVFGVIHE